MIETPAPPKTRRQLKRVDLEPLFAKIDVRAKRWLEAEAKERGLTVAKLLSELLVERMRGPVD